MIREVKSIKKKALKYSETCLQSNQDGDVPIEKFFMNYVNKGEKNFKWKETVFGEEEIVSYDYLDVLQTYIYGIDIPKAIIEFEKTKDEYCYLKLLNGYFKDSLLGIECLNEQVYLKGKLHTDISLSVLFCICYFPGYVEKIADYLVAYLKKNKDRINNYSSTSEYGLSSTLYLSAFLVRYAGYTSLGDSIFDFCREPDPIYRYACENILSEDAGVVKKWVDEMSDYHIKNSKEDHTVAFNREYWQYYPIEIISLLQLRGRSGKFFDFVQSPLLLDFLPFIQQDVPVQLNKETEELTARIR